MIRVIIFNVTGMELYNGIENGDNTSIFGGEYVKRNRSGGEIFNFQDYNGYCYGYVSAINRTVKVERIDDISEDNDKIDNVLVIWTAKHNKDQKNVIVGWYKNATVYRNLQVKDQFPGLGRRVLYQCKAKSEDCFLLPMSKRKYVIGRATEEGTGMGLGQSNVWFADSVGARKKIIPQIVNYINSYTGVRINTVFDQDAINVLLSDKSAGIEGVPDEKKAEILWGKGFDSLKAGDYYRALAFFNTSIKHDTKNFGDNNPIRPQSDTYFNIRSALRSLNCFDESIKYFEKVVELEGESEEVLELLIYLYDAAEMDQKALGVANKLLNLVDSSDVAKMSSIYTVISDVNVRLNNLEEAINALDEIIKITTDKDLKEALMNDRKYLTQR